MSECRVRWLRLLYASVIVCGGLSGISGCGRSDTVSISGQVNLDNQPLATGDIEIIPAEETGGPTVGGVISDGRYAFPASHGPRKGGKYRVEIRSLDASSGSTSHPLSRGKAVYLDRIPAAYNSDSQLNISIPTDVSNFEHDFHLRSKAK